MFKQTIASIIILSTVLSGGSSSATAATALPEPVVGQIGIDIIVDGLKTTFPDAEPFVDNGGYTMVPVRFVSEQLGAKVLWDNKNQIATIQYNGKNIVMPVNSKVVTVDGADSTLDTAARMVDGRTFVPLRFVSETLGAEVKYDAGYVGITVSSKEFLDQVASGAIQVDNYGRKIRTTNLPKSADKWTVLEDTENWAYDVGLHDPGPWSENHVWAKDMYEQQAYILKEDRDRMALNIKKRYQAQLNYDYRTTTVDSMYSILKDLYWQIGGTMPKSGITSFDKFAKQNHVIVQGYAFPEENTLYYRNTYYFMRTKFKFRVISADDMTQFNMDSYKPTGASTSPTWVKKGQWYVGYSDVMLWSNGMNYQWMSARVADAENMFLTGASQYKELK